MDRDWVHRSACKGLDPIIFYPATDDEADAAKAVCAECPVQEQCLEHAIGHREHNGVWGGATERERQRIIRRRRRVRAMGGTNEGTTTAGGAPRSGGLGDDDGMPVIASSAVGR